MSVCAQKRPRVGAVLCGGAPQGSKSEPNSLLSALRPIIKLTCAGAMFITHLRIRMASRDCKHPSAYACIVTQRRKLIPSQVSARPGWQFPAGRVVRDKTRDAIQEMRIATHQAREDTLDFSGRRPNLCRATPRLVNRRLPDKVGHGYKFQTAIRRQAAELAPSAGKAIAADTECTKSSRTILGEVLEVSFVPNPIAQAEVQYMYLTWFPAGCGIGENSDAQPSLFLPGSPGLRETSPRR